MRISDWSSDVCSSDLLVRRQRDAARAEDDYVERRALGGRGVFLGDLVEPARGGHPFDFEADAIGRGRAADIAPHHLSPARSVEDDPRDRKSVGEGKSVSVRVDLGGGRLNKKKKQ